MRRRALLLLFALGLGAWGPCLRAEPPRLLWDVTFDADPLGAMPPALSLEAQRALAADPWTVQHSYTRIDFVTPTRTATVVAEANGMTHQPVLFDLRDSGQPNWGPRMWFQLPNVVADSARRLRLSLDMAMASQVKTGGINLNDELSITFFEDGSLHANSAELCRYQPNHPTHLDILIDNEARTFTVTANDDPGTRMVLPWRHANGGPFHSLRLDGLLPGGHSRKGRVAFDNIRLELLERR